MGCGWSPDCRCSSRRVERTAPDPAFLQTSTGQANTPPDPRDLGGGLRPILPRQGWRGALANRQG